MEIQCRNCGKVLNREEHDFKLRQGKGKINYTILLCIRNTTKNGVVCCEVVKRSANSKVFNWFLTKIKFAKLPNSEKIPLLMDNVKFH